MQFKLTNTSQDAVDEYVKIDLYSKQGLLATTKYVPITNLDPGHTKEYQVKFKANDINSYKLAIVDLSNMTIFGTKLTDIFSWDNLKTTGGNAWRWTINFLGSIPWWGYAIGAGIILWYMPTGYLFGIFPL